METILLATSDRKLQKELKELFRGRFIITLAGTARESLRVVNKQEVHLVLLDTPLPGVGTEELVREVKSNASEAVIVSLSPPE